MNGVIAKETVRPCLVACLTGYEACIFPHN